MTIKRHFLHCFFDNMKKTVRKGNAYGSREVFILINQVGT